MHCFKTFSVKNSLCCYDFKKFFGEQLKFRFFVLKLVFIILLITCKEFLFLLKVNLIHLPNPKHCQRIEFKGDLASKLMKKLFLVCFGDIVNASTLRILVRLRQPFSFLSRVLRFVLKLNQIE